PPPKGLACYVPPPRQVPIPPPRTIPAGYSAPAPHHPGTMAALGGRRSAPGGGGGRAGPGSFPAFPCARPPYISGPTGRDPAPPGGLRPAQLGVVLVGRVLLGHVGATVVDLACRGCLTVEPLDEDGSDWRLTVMPAVPEDLLGYEQAIVHGLLGEQA